MTSDLQWLVVRPQIIQAIPLLQTIVACKVRFLSINYKANRNFAIGLYLSFPTFSTDQITNLKTNSCNAMTKNDQFSKIEHDRDNLELLEFR